MKFLEVRFAIADLRLVVDPCSSLKGRDISSSLCIYGDMFRSLKRKADRQCLRMIVLMEMRDCDLLACSDGEP